MLEALATHLSCSRKQAKALLDRRVVFVNRRRVWMAKHTVKPGDTLEITETEIPGQNNKLLAILFEDAHYVAVAKPAGILSNGHHSVETRLRKQLKSPTLQAVHRLDKDTSGALLFARSQKATDAAIKMWEADRVTKVYRALVHGRFRDKEGEIHTDIDGVQAVTRYRALSTNKLASHVQVQILTGRTHQIRKHLFSINHPVLGDPKHARARVVDDVLRTAPRQMLHAYTLALPHPYTGKILRAQAPLPSDFKAMMRRCKLT